MSLPEEIVNFHYLGHGYFDGKRNKYNYRISINEQMEVPWRLRADKQQQHPVLGAMPDKLFAAMTSESKKAGRNYN